MGGFEDQGRQGGGMKPVIVECEQRTPEWFAARAGRVTGSVAADMLAKLKSGGEPAARRDLRLQLAVETLTGTPMEASGFVSPAMQRGIEAEPLARGRYEAETGNMVRTTGFVIREDLAVGCSLDGDIRNFEGILEIKCPKSATHCQYLKDKRLPPDYVAQVTHNLWVTGAKWCDFVSWDDRMPAGLDFFMVRVMRDEAVMAAYESDLRRFLAEVESEVGQLRNLQQSRK
jgi:predicted phage-related endonuclease